MPALTPNATLTRSLPLPDGLVRMWVRPDWDLNDLTWEAGQFLRCGVPEGQDTDKKRLRAMSFAGVQGDEIELYIVAVEGGVTSPRLAALQPGDRLYCEAKFAGHFTLSATPSGRTLWWIGTGTGIAPFVCMLRHAQEALQAWERIVFVHSVRRAAHLTFGTELLIAAQHDPRLRYLPVVTREDDRFVARDGHAPLRGRVQDHLTSGDLARAADTPLDPTDAIVMLCGNPGLIKEATLVLESQGFQKHKKRTPGNVLNERYW